ncbi:MAG: hypothetical protein RQM92_08695 [Candidatus Syntrophopropionicum ammoniitolerans]
MEIGFESFVHVNAGDRSLALGNIIHRRVSSFYKSSGFVDRGRKNADFAMLRLTQMPALLLENLFGSFLSWLKPPSIT